MDYGHKKLKYVVCLGIMMAVSEPVVANMLMPVVPKPDYEPLSEANVAESIVGSDYSCHSPRIKRSELFENLPKDYQKGNIVHLEVGCTMVEFASSLEEMQKNTPSALIHLTLEDCAISKKADGFFDRTELSHNKLWKDGIAKNASEAHNDRSCKIAYFSGLAGYNGEVFLLKQTKMKSQLANELNKTPSAENRQQCLQIRINLSVLNFSGEEVYELINQQKVELSHDEVAKKRALMRTAIRQYCQ